MSGEFRGRHLKRRALANLHVKLDDAPFAHDLDALINTMPAGYTLEDAAGVAEAVIAALGS